MQKNKLKRIANYKELKDNQIYFLIFFNVSKEGIGFSVIIKSQEELKTFKLVLTP